MDIKKKTMDCFRGLRNLCTKWTAEDFRKAGVKIEQEAIPVAETHLQNRLDAAAHALSVIEARTANGPVLTHDDVANIHSVALTAYRMATK